MRTPHSKAKKIIALAAALTVLVSGTAVFADKASKQELEEAAKAKPAKVAKTKKNSAKAESKKEEPKQETKAEEQPNAQPEENKAPEETGTVSGSVEVTADAGGDSNANGGNESQPAPAQNQTPIQQEQAPAAQPAAEPKPVQNQTSGINWLGHHFPIAPFSGVNGEKTPSWTPYVFQWTALPNYYLAEAASAAGQAVFGLKIGDEIILNGQVLHVTQIVPNMHRKSSSATVFSLARQHKIGIQVCEDLYGNYVRTYWAD